MSEKTMTPLGMAIIQMSDDAGSLGQQILNTANGMTSLWQDLANLRTQRESAEGILAYTVAEMRIELFANVPTRKAKSKTEEAPEADPANSVITATTKEEREGQFEHHLAKLGRTEPNHPYTRALITVNAVKFKEEEVQQRIKDSERKLSAMRTVADLNAARLSALSAVLG